MKKQGLWLFPLCVFLLLSACSSLGKDMLVTEISGGVTVVREGENTPLTLKKPKLREGDTITVADDGRARLRLDNYKETILCPGTQMIMRTDGKGFFPTLVTGSALFRIDRALDTAETFGVLVGNVSAEVRGTVFSLHIEAPDAALLCVYSGRVALCSYNSGGEFTTATAGQAVRFNPVNAVPIGALGEIDYAALPAVIAECVQDYSSTSALASTASPSPEPESPPESPSSEVADSLPALPSSSSAPASSSSSGSKEDDSSSSKPKPPPPPTPTPIAPTCSLQYMWDSTVFRPYLNFAWRNTDAEYLTWQLYDSGGTALGDKGRFEREHGILNLTRKLLELTYKTDNGLYPQGYSIRVTPYYTNARDRSTAADTIMLELPYLTLSAEKKGDALTPVIATNLGFWFEHSYGGLTSATENGKLRIFGSFMPKQGDKHPIVIDLVTE